MRYFANASSLAVREAMVSGEIGMLTTPNEGRDPGRLHVHPTCIARRCSDSDHHRPAAVWAADNGCYSTRYVGDEKWLAWLTRHAVHAVHCLFATAPDVVGDAAATLERSSPFLPVIRELGYAPALVAQDGLEHLRVPWDGFDVLFIGGSTDWKLSAAAVRLAAEARVRGKSVHMGRVNSGSRLAYATVIGCESADGTFLAFGPDTNLARLRKWSRGTDALSLFDIAPATLTQETTP